MSPSPQRDPVRAPLRRANTRHFAGHFGGTVRSVPERAYYRDTEELAEHVNRLSRRVVPAHCDGDGNVVDATEPSSFWCLLGPGDSEPTAEHEAVERARRAATTAASETRP